MRSRLGLDDLLRSMAPHVYFQPAESVKMKYPCIIYSLDDYSTHHADNLPYMVTKCYQVTVVDKDPDSVIKDQVALLPQSRFVRHFTKDNLNQDVFEIYY